MDNQVDEKAAQKIAKFENRMAVVERDNSDLAQACRNVHSQLSLAKAVAESVFNDEVSTNPEVVMNIAASVADELEDIRTEREDHENRGDEDEGGLA